MFYRSHHIDSISGVWCGCNLWYNGPLIIVLLSIIIFYYICFYLSTIYFFFLWTKYYFLWIFVCFIRSKYFFTIRIILKIYDISLIYLLRIHFQLCLYQQGIIEICPKTQWSYPWTINHDVNLLIKFLLYLILLNS